MVSPPEAQRCDCGYDFLAQTVKASYLLGASLPPGFRVADLLAIARGQKAVIAAVGAQIFVVLVWLTLLSWPLLVGARSENNSLLLTFACCGAVILVGVLSLVAQVRLAERLKAPTLQTLCVLGAFIPVVGLLTLVALSGAATRILRQAGIHVGFFGARAVDMEALAKSLSGPSRR
jgi:hypothetical protein